MLTMLTPGVLRTLSAAERSSIGNMTSTVPAFSDSMRVSISGDVLEDYAVEIRTRARPSSPGCAHRQCSRSAHARRVGTARCRTLLARSGAGAMSDGTIAP